MEKDANANTNIVDILGTLTFLSCDKYHTDLNAVEESKSENKSPYTKNHAAIRYSVIKSHFHYNNNTKKQQYS